MNFDGYNFVHAESKPFWQIHGLDFEFSAVALFTQHVLYGLCLCNESFMGFMTSQTVISNAIMKSAHEMYGIICFLTLAI